MTTPPFRETFGGSWESFRHPIGTVMIYCCRRPKGYDNWIANRFPWAHVYVMEQQQNDPLNGIDGPTIEHYRFMTESPLELQSVIYDMVAKYSP